MDFLLLYLMHRVSMDPICWLTEALIARKKSIERIFSFFFQGRNLNFLSNVQNL